jgi:phenylalanine-4-hydroxylase
MMADKVFDPEQVTRVRFQGEDYDVTYVHEKSYDALLALYREAVLALGEQLTELGFNGTDVRLGRDPHSRIVG